MVSRRHHHPAVDVHSHEHDATAATAAPTKTGSDSAVSPNTQSVFKFPLRQDIFCIFFFKLGSNLDPHITLVLCLINPL